MSKAKTFNAGDDLTELVFAEYHPASVVRARRIDGPFVVVGDTHCEDGWLVVDPATGEMSAVADGEFQRRYRPHYGDTVDRLADLAAEAVKSAAEAPPEKVDAAELASEIGGRIRSEATP